MHRLSALRLAAIITFTFFAATAAWAVRAAPDDAGSSGEAMLSHRPAPPRPGQPAFPEETRTSDPDTLDARLAASGYTLPEGASVYAAKVFAGGDGDLAYLEYEAGGGGFTDGFWPASTIKLLAAEGALEFVHTLGFTGAATVTSDDGWSASVRDLAESAVVDSSNEAYDMLVQVAGVDWLNDVFLTAANGYPDSVIQRSYSGIDVRSSPAMTLTDGSRTVSLPPRASDDDYGCSDNGNCSTLFELAESVDRVVLDAAQPASRRLPLDPSDVAALGSDLLVTQGFVEPGVKEALGPQAMVWAKPGWVSGLDCVDAGVVEDRATASTYLLGVTVPDSGVGCDVLADIAENVLSVLAR